MTEEIEKQLNQKRQSLLLRVVMNKGGLTQTELADATGYSQAYISQMLSSDRRVQAEVLTKARELARARLMPLLDGGEDSGAEVNARIRERAGRQAEMKPRIRRKTGRQ